MSLEKQKYIVPSVIRYENRIIVLMDLAVTRLSPNFTCNIYLIN